MRAFVKFLVAACILSFWQCVNADQLWNLHWLEVRTPHFDLVSALDEKSSRELATRLENFRFAATLLTNAQRLDERVPNYVYIFPWTVTELSLPSYAEGEFSPKMGANYIVIYRNTVHVTLEKLQHEYTHFLIHNQNAVEYPMWYEEGLASMMQTLKINGNVMEYGRAPPNFREFLLYNQWAPYGKIISGKLQHLSVFNFYTQSWLLLHYFTFGRRDHNLAAESNRYLKLLL